MKLHVRHTFPCTPQRFWELFWDPELDTEALRTASITREWLSDNDDGNTRIWRVRMVPDRELPKPLAKLLGSNKLVYEQQCHLDRSQNQLTWEVIPAVFTDKITAKGTLTVVPTETGCVREVIGDVDVKVRLIGGRIEKAIISDVKKSYDRAAQVRMAHLEKKA